MRGVAESARQLSQQVGFPALWPWGQRYRSIGCCPAQPIGHLCEIDNKALACRLYEAHARSIVHCVIANAATAIRLRVRTPDFDRRAAEVFGKIPQYRLAEHLNTHPTTLSQVRGGHREPTVEFICDTLIAFAHRGQISASFGDYFEVVPLADAEGER